MNSKTRAFLRAKANIINPSCTIGKGGLTDNIFSDISDALEAHELIKVNVLKNSEYTAKEIANDVATELSADVVGVVGNRFILYRRSSKDIKHILED